MTNDFTENKVISWIKKFTCTPIYNNKNIREIIEYEGISLWWFIDIYIYKRIKAIVDEGTDECFSYVQSSGKHLVLARTIIRFLFGKILHLFYRKRGRLKVMVVSSHLSWRIASDSYLKKTKKDIVVGGIIERLVEKGYRVIALDQTTMHGGEIKGMIEKTLQEPGIWMPSETYITPQTISKVLGSRKGLEEKWKALEGNPKFINALTYGGRSLFKSLRRDFQLCVKFHIPKDIFYIEIMKNAVRVEKPDLVLVTGEYASLGLAAIIAGKQERIPTLAIPHGLITPDSRAYMYAKDEISPQGNFRSPYHPIPDKIAVYGEYDKTILTEVSSYPKESILITGQPRYDILSRVDELFDRKTTFKRLGLKPEKKLVVWTTQSQGLSQEENDRSFRAVYSTIKQLSDEVQLIVKLHPNERNTTMHKQIAEEIGIDPLIVRDVDIYEVVYACDLLITKHSITGREAIAMNKPVIVLDLGKERMYIEYIKEGVALAAHNEEDLKNAIRELLKDDSKLAEKRKHYIEKYLHKIDGKSTERVIALIEEMIETKKNGKNTAG